MTPDTPLQIASSSKPITAVALLHLLEERAISPDTTFLSLLDVPHVVRLEAELPLR